MKNIFIRQKTFYFRKNIPFYLQIYFNNQTRFIRSLQTKSKTKAFKYVLLLNKKFEAIKEVYKMNFIIDSFYGFYLVITFDNHTDMMYNMSMVVKKEGDF